MTEYIYKIHRIPTEDTTLLPFLAGKFASLRLSALTVSAPAFSSTFEIESKFNHTQWIARLSRPLIHTFLAVAYSPSTPDSQQTISAGDVIGSATFLGPIPLSTYTVPLSGGPSPGPDEDETKWQMTAVYNSPSHRGKGVAKMLCKAAVEFAEEKSEGRGTRVRIMIHPRNALVREMYGRLGFVDAGKMTLAEAFLSNGDGELLPEDGGKSEPEKYDFRAGLIMERVSEAKALIFSIEPSLGYAEMVC